MQRKLNSLFSLIIILGLVIPMTGARPIAAQDQAEFSPISDHTPNQIDYPPPLEDSQRPDIETLPFVMGEVEQVTTTPRLTGMDSSSRYGPQRNDPALGVPAHAYSPFNDLDNEEATCPPGGCDAMAGLVLIKFAEDVDVAKTGTQYTLSGNPTLNSTLTGQGIMNLEAVFPNAQAPKQGEMILSALGERLLKPDLTRWYRASLDDGADVYTVVEALHNDPDGAVPRTISAPVSAPLALPGPGTDPLYSQQWHLDATNVPQAWQWLETNGYEPGGHRDIVVAVIDTGVDYNHPDLAVVRTLCIRMAIRRTTTGTAPMSPASSLRKLATARAVRA